MSERKEKFTPGPWLVRNGSDVIDHHGVFICENHATTEVASANRVLIAAAPDMYAALESALSVAEFENHPFRPWHDSARAALSKARGES